MAAERAMGGSIKVWVRLLGAVELNEPTVQPFNEDCVRALPQEQQCTDRGEEQCAWDDDEE